MTSIENDLARVESEIARANPVPPASLPPADSPYARHVLREVLAAPASAHDRTQRGRRPLWLSNRRGTWLGVAAAAAVTIAAVAGSQLLHGSSPGKSAARNPRAVTDVLTALAGVAAGQPAVRPPGPGQYQYTESVSRGLAELAYGRRPFWVSYLVSRQIADGRPRLSAGGWDQRFGPHGLTLGPVNEWKLPTDPAQLGALLRQRAIEGGPPGPREDFVQVGDLLRETGAPPALRAALFKVAASIPGVRVLGRVTDRLGRAGIVVAYTDRPPAGKDPGTYGLTELIFAPKTSALLDEQTVLVDTRTHTRTVTSWTVYIASGVVDSTTAVAPPYGGTATRPGPA